MAKLFQLEIVTPEKKAVSTEVEEISVPTFEGEISILAGHQNLISHVVPGELRIIHKGQTENMAVGDGFVKVTAGKVSIITDLAAAGEDIIEAEVEQARKDAEEALKEKTLSEEEYALAAANLQKALAQLKIKRRHRS